MAKQIKQVISGTKGQVIYTNKGVLGYAPEPGTEEASPVRKALKQRYCVDCGVYIGSGVSTQFCGVDMPTAYSRTMEPQATHYEKKPRPITGKESQLLDEMEKWPGFLKGEVAD